MILNFTESRCGSRNKTLQQVPVPSMSGRHSSCWFEVTNISPSSVTSRVQRDSLHVYQQDVDLTSELTAYCGLRRKGKLLATHMQLVGRTADCLHKQTVLARCLGKVTGA